MRKRRLCCIPGSFTIAPPLCPPPHPAPFVPLSRNIDPNTLLCLCLASPLSYNDSNKNDMTLVVTPYRIWVTKLVFPWMRADVQVGARAVDIHISNSN
ncbi:hypothetical protein EVAR_92624_1 [Eumeta japonica]|uniref:Uncharacterized protein n=1 Tax=Eumeta variegata TaxID=151549 RepID=A0A4C1SXM0_EUMVA|nr:hypothetical protein EVAR_92624_1 [Eumeta japonica]